MSKDQEAPNRQPVQNTSEERERIAPIRQAVIALQRRTRQALSPWIRDRLRATTGSQPGEKSRSARRDRRGRTALTVGNTRLLLNRVQRTVERGTVWKPNVGSLRPGMVERFTRTVAGRLTSHGIQPIGIQRQAQPLAWDWEEDLELVLPVGSPSSGPGKFTVGSKMKGPSVFSVGQRIEPLASVSAAAPWAPRPAAPSRAMGRPRPKKLSPSSRLYARVEEILPGEKTRPEAERPPESWAQGEQDRAGAEETTTETPARGPEPRRAVEPPPAQREGGADMPLRLAGAPAGEELISERPEGQPQVHRMPHRAAEPPVQRWEAPEMPSRTEPRRTAPPEPSPLPPETGAAVEPPPIRREEAPFARPEGQAAEPPFTRREAEPDKLPRTRPPEKARPGQPPPSPEAGQAVEPPPVQREEALDMPLRVEQPGKAVPEPSERMMEPRRTVGPSLVRREEAAEMPLRAQPPREVPAGPPARLPEPARVVEPSPVRREETAEVPLRARPPREAPVGPPARPSEPGRVAEPLLVRREEAAEMPLRARPPREAPVGPPARPPEPAQAAEPLVRRHVEQDTSGEPPMTLGRDILGRAAARTRLPLSKPPAPASSRTAGVRRKVRPGLVKMKRRPLTTRRLDRALGRVRSRIASPALYTRSPDVYVGPGPSLTLSGLESTHLDRTRPASIRSISRTVESSQVQALFEVGRARGDARMTLPLPLRPAPASSGSSARSSRAKADRSGQQAKAITVPSIASQPDELSLPLAPLPAPRSAPAEVIQRQPVSPGTSLIQEAEPLPPTIVQRAEGSRTSGDSGGEPDLKELAQRVYPLIKRMLVIERERRPDR